MSKWIRRSLHSPHAILCTLPSSLLVIVHQWRFLNSPQSQYDTLFDFDVFRRRLATSASAVIASLQRGHVHLLDAITRAAMDPEQRLEVRAASSVEQGLLTTLSMLPAVPDAAVAAAMPAPASLASFAASPSASLEAPAGPAASSAGVTGGAASASGGPIPADLVSGLGLPLTTQLACASDDISSVQDLDTQQNI